MYAKTHADIPMTHEELGREVAKIQLGVAHFADEMRERLVAKLKQGWRGWDDPNNAEEIYRTMLAHSTGVPMAVGQEIDIANFAMFLWYQRTQRSYPAAGDR